MSFWTVKPFRRFSCVRSTLARFKFILTRAYFAVLLANGALKEGNIISNRFVLVAAHSRSPNLRRSFFGCVQARETVVGLARDIGPRGVHAGAVVNAAAVEALTSLLIAVNMRYKVPGAGIRITGLPQSGNHGS